MRLEKNKLTKDKCIELDKFYTKESVSLYCYKKLTEYLKSCGLNDKNTIFIEPSAGAGSFLKHIKSEKIGFDIHPENSSIIKHNFIDGDISLYIPKDKHCVFIGNPPFGKNSSLAVKFLNKAFQYSSLVGFILPKTFKKQSILNRINLDYECVEEYELPKDSFTLMGNDYDVPCIFQIWIKGNGRKIKSKTLTSKLFNFVEKKEADFAIRRVGVYAGKLFKEFEQYQPSSNYFIKSKIEKTELLNILDNSYKLLNDLAKNCAGNPSLSKVELIEQLESNCALEHL